MTLENRLKLFRIFSRALKYTSIAMGVFFLTAFLFYASYLIFGDNPFVYLSLVVFLIFLAASLVFARDNIENEDRENEILLRHLGKKYNAS